MRNKPRIPDIFDALEIEVRLLAEKTKEDEHSARIRGLSLLLEDRVDSLYRQLKFERWKNIKPVAVESKTEKCICGLPWVYEDTVFGRVFGRCKDENCFINAK